MKKIQSIILLSTLLGLTITFQACKKEGCTDPDATNYDSKAKEDDGSCMYDEEHGEHASIVFKFEHVVGSDDLEYDTMKFTNAAGNLYEVENMKYIVSDFVLHTSSGMVELEDEHYIDAADPTTHTYDPGEDIETGSYTSVSFTFGIDSIENTAGKFSNAPESNMAWPAMMGTGYHYMKLEGKYDSAGTTKNYNIHLGPSNGGAGMGVVGNDYSVDITLSNSSFTATDHGEIEVIIKVDINEWFKSPNIYDFNTYGEIIMPNQVAQEVLQENGASVFSLDHIHE